MKVALSLGGIALALAAAAYLFLRQADLVTSRYPTLNDARADRVFERGWLPDILPKSARFIRTTNDADINTSEGDFRFAPADYWPFASRLRPRSTLAALSEDRDEYVRAMQELGYQSGIFSDADSTWLFVCQEQVGYCKYTMWSERK